MLGFLTGCDCLIHGGVDEPVCFKSSGWIDATDVAKRFEKKPVEWLRLPATERYIAALARGMPSHGKVGLSHLGLDVRKSDFKLVETRQYLAALVEALNTRDSGDLIHTQVGGNSMGNGL